MHLREVRALLLQTSGETVLRAEGGTCARAEGGAGPGRLEEQ